MLLLSFFCVFIYTSNINQINVVSLLTITSLESCILFDIWFLILFFTLQSMTSFVLWKFFNFVSFFKIFSSTCHVIRRNFIGTDILIGYENLTGYVILDRNRSFRGNNILFTIKFFQEPAFLLCPTKMLMISVTSA